MGYLLRVEVWSEDQFVLLYRQGPVLTSTLAVSQQEDLPKIPALKVRVKGKQSHPSFGTSLLVELGRSTGVSAVVNFDTFLPQHPRGIDTTEAAHPFLVDHASERFLLQ